MCGGPNLAWVPGWEEDLQYLYPAFRIVRGRWGHYAYWSIVRKDWLSPAQQQPWVPITCSGLYPGGGIRLPSRLQERQRGVL